MKLEKIAGTEDRQVWALTSDDGTEIYGEVGTFGIVSRCTLAPENGSGLEPADVCERDGMGLPAARRGTGISADERDGAKRRRGADRANRTGRRKTPAEGESTIVDRWEDSQQSGGDRAEHRELAFNGAGYWDPTAAEALKKIVKEERKMGGTGFEAATGDIWLLQTDDEKERLFLVLANRGKYMTGLTLYESTNNPDAIEVKARGTMYTDLGRVSYVHATRMENFIRALTDAELEYIQEGVAEALGLTAVCKKEQQELQWPLPYEDAQLQIAAGRDGDTQASEDDYRIRVDAEATRLIEQEERRRREAEEKVEQLLDLQAEVERECRGARSEAATYRAKAEAYKEILMRVLPTKGD